MVNLGKKIPILNRPRTFVNHQLPTPDCFAYLFHRQYALTTASCFMNMFIVSQMVKNKASDEDVRKRILSGKDMKPNIGGFVGVKVFLILMNS